MKVKLGFLGTFLYLGLLKGADSAAAGIPSFLQPCRLNDPNLNECARISAQNGIKAFTQGDPERNLPVLDPIFLKRVKPLSGGALNMLLLNSTVHRTGDLKVKKLNVDVKKMKIEARLFGDMNMKGKYEVNGRILILPITGKGDLFIDVKNGNFKFTIDYKLVEKNGKTQVKILKTQLSTISVEKVTFKLTNLFGGDRLLGENINKVLNEAWKDVYDELSAAVFAEVDKIITKAIQRLFDSATYEELLLPD